MPELIQNDSVALLLTPPGSAAIAVVRIAGPNVVEFLRTHFSKPARLNQCVHGELRDGARIIDDALVVRVNETVADLNLHGGAWVVQSTLDLARRAGFRVLDRPQLPLSLIAIDAGSSLEAEVLSHLPLARTELGVQALLAQADNWRDFKSRALKPEMLRMIPADRTMDCLLFPRRVAIVGAANVGKSTLANQLFAQERSITADVPGTTRDWVGEIANIDGLPVMLLDTPGLRATEDRIEAEAIQRSGREIETADATVLVVDASRPLEGEQSELLKRFPGAIRVVNKMDKQLGWNPDQLGALPIIATRGEGVDYLRRRIVSYFCGEERVEIGRPRCWTERQRTIVQRAMNEPAAIDEM